MIIVGIFGVAYGAPVLGCILVSLGWGYTFTSIVLARRAVVLSPVFREVTNWERVESLIREYDDHAA
jgi:hypothetical protein